MSPLLYLCTRLSSIPARRLCDLVCSVVHLLLTYKAHSFLMITHYLYKQHNIIFYSSLVYNIQVYRRYNFIRIVYQVSSQINLKLMYHHHHHHHHHHHCHCHHHHHHCYHHRHCHRQHSHHLHHPHNHHSHHHSHCQHYHHHHYHNHHHHHHHHHQLFILKIIKTVIQSHTNISNIYMMQCCHLATGGREKLLLNLVIFLADLKSLHTHEM